MYFLPNPIRYYVRTVRYGSTCLREFRLDRSCSHSAARARALSLPTFILRSRILLYYVIDRQYTKFLTPKVLPVVSNKHAIRIPRNQEASRRRWRLQGQCIGAKVHQHHSCILRRYGPESQFRTPWSTYGLCSPRLPVVE